MPAPSLPKGAKEPSWDYTQYPEVYDAAIRTGDDVKFYLQVVKEARAESVLEFGVGTGRVAIPMAHQGHRICGIDRSLAMLATADRKLGKLELETRQRVHLLAGDVRMTRLKQRFDVVLAPFNMFAHLCDDSDREAVLDNARRHLVQGGLFVFDTFHPGASSETAGTRMRSTATTFRNLPSGERYEEQESRRYDFKARKLLLKSTYRLVSATGRTLDQFNCRTELYWHSDRYWKEALNQRGFCCESPGTDFSEPRQGAPQKESTLRVWHAKLEVSG